METELFHMLFFQGIVRGKLDQLRRCFEVRVHSCRLFFCNSQVISVLFLHFVLLIQVQFAAGRDLRPEQLNNMIQTLANWYILLFRKYLLIMSHSVFSFIGYELFCVLLLIYLNYSLLVVCQYNLLILSKQYFCFHMMYFVQYQQSFWSCVVDQQMQVSSGCSVDFVVSFSSRCLVIFQYLAVQYGTGYYAQHLWGGRRYMLWLVTLGQ